MDEDAPSEVTVLSLNVWGLLAISKQRKERLIEIGRTIARRDPVPHIVALQECFVQEDYEAVRRETRFALPYGKYYQSGAFGSGLVILSRWPIEESWLFEYPLNGRPTKIFQGDWYVGKGLAGVRVRMGKGEGDCIEVFNTHTQAPYDGEPHTVHRLSQSWELSKHLNNATRSSSTGSLVLAMGDFNMKPTSLLHKIVTARAPLMRDTWRVLHPDSSLGCTTDPLERARRRPIPTVAFNITENGCTSNNVTNTWRWDTGRRKLLNKSWQKKTEEKKEGKKGNGNMRGLKEGGVVALGGADGESDEDVPPRLRIKSDALDERAHRIDYVFANVAGSEAEGEWEEISPPRPGTAGGENKLEKKGSGSSGILNGGSLKKDASTIMSDRDRESKSSSRRTGGPKRGVHFEEQHGHSDGSTTVGAEDMLHHAQTQTPKPVWVVRSSRVAMTERHPELGCSLSDHYGVEVTLVRRTPKRKSGGDRERGGRSVSPPSAMKKGTRPSTPPPGPEEGTGAFLDSPTASERRESSDTVTHLQTQALNGNNGGGGDNPHHSLLPPPPSTSSLPDNTPLTQSHYSAILKDISAYTTSQHQNQRYRYLHFCISIIITAALLVTVFFVPPYAAFVVMVAGLFNFALGLGDGYYALVWLGREERKLAEFAWEVGNARDREVGVGLEREAQLGRSGSVKRGGSVRRVGMNGNGGGGD